MFRPEQSPLMERRYALMEDADGVVMKCRFLVSPRNLALVAEIKERAGELRDSLTQYGMPNEDRPATKSAIERLIVMLLELARLDRVLASHYYTGRICEDCQRLLTAMNQPLPETPRKQGSA